MSFPTFADFNKPVLDALKDDFDTKVKYTLKVKADAPSSVKVTQTTEYVDGKLLGKVSAKWAGKTGFSLDKFEIKSNGAITTETSLDNLAPGLKLEFKGNDDKLGDFGVEYKHQLATATAVFNMASFDSVKASVNGGANNFTAGAAVELKIGDKTELSSFDVATSYALPKNFFVGVQTSNKFTGAGATFSYAGLPQYNFVGKVNYATASKATSFEVGGAYSCCKNTTMKAKVNQDGVVSLSVKQALCNKTTVVAALLAEPKNLANFKFGINATLG